MEDVQCPKLPWMIDFHSTGEGTVFNAQLGAVYKRNHLNYLESLNIDSEPPRTCLTGIMCSFGPSCCTSKILEDMMGAGMKILRINTAFYTLEGMKEFFELVKLARDNFSKKIGKFDK